MQPIAPVEVAHRSCSACLIHHIAMKVKRKVFWDPVKERFKNDDEANAMVSRPAALAVRDQLTAVAGPALSVLAVRLLCPE